jgi:hypothetical protein
MKSEVVLIVTRIKVESIKSEFNIYFGTKGKFVILDSDYKVHRINLMEEIPKNVMPIAIFLKGESPRIRQKFFDWLSEYLAEKQCLFFMAVHPGAAEGYGFEMAKEDLKKRNCPNTPYSIPYSLGWDGTGNPPNNPICKLGMELRKSLGEEKDLVQVEHKDIEPMINATIEFIKNKINVPNLISLSIQCQAYLLAHKPPKDLFYDLSPIESEVIKAQDAKWWGGISSEKIEEELNALGINAIESKEITDTFKSVQKKPISDDIESLQKLVFATLSAKN